MSRYQYHACEHCGCPGVETAYRYCGRCEGKRRGLTTELTREPRSDDDRPVRCIHCRRQGADRVCPSCVVLLAELGAEDSTTESTERPRKGSGNPDLPCQSVSSVVNPPPEHNGYWLYQDARKAGDLDQVIAYGREHGFPKMLKDWSRGMVAQANRARSVTIP